MIKKTWIFIALVLVLGVHYLFITSLYRRCVVLGEELLENQFTDTGALIKLRGDVPDTVGICPGFFDDIKNARNRGVDILLALGFGTAVVAAATSNGKLKKKEEEELNQEPPVVPDDPPTPPKPQNPSPNPEFDMSQRRRPPTPPTK